MNIFSFLATSNVGSFCNSQAAYVVRAGRRLLAGACNQRASASSLCKGGGSPAALSGGRKLTKRSGEGSLRPNRVDATPAVHSSALSSAAHGGRGAGCARLCDKLKECRGFLTPMPTVSMPKTTRRQRRAGSSSGQIVFLYMHLFDVRKIRSCDVTLVSALTCEGRPRLSAATRDGAPITLAERRQRVACPELLRPGPS